jgi:hypothetical protein
MIVEADAIREDQFNKGEFVGVIKVISDDIPATRVEFRRNNGALDINEMATLDKVFGGLRPQLFEKAKVVRDIITPQALIDGMRKAGLNPWDYLEIKTKTNMDDIVSQYPGCTTDEAILPKKGLLARLKENATILSDEAKSWIKVYLDKALKTTPVLGTKGKS